MTRRPTSGLQQSLRVVQDALHNFGMTAAMTSSDSGTPPFLANRRLGGRIAIL